MQKNTKYPKFDHFHKQKSTFFYGKFIHFFQKKICQKNLGNSKYNLFNKVNIFFVSHNDMGCKKNCKFKKIMLNLGCVNFLVTFFF